MLLLQIIVSVHSPLILAWNTIHIPMTVYPLFLTFFALHPYVIRLGVPTETARDFHQLSSSGMELDSPVIQVIVVETSHIFLLLLFKYLSRN